MNYLLHYGIPKRSGRYPWGSGERPYQGDVGYERVNRKNPVADKLLAPKIRPNNDEFAKKYILKRATSSAIGYGAVMAGMSAYSKLTGLDLPLPKIKTNAIIAGMTFVSNYLYDTIDYKLTGTIRK